MRGGGEGGDRKKSVREKRKQLNMGNENNTAKWCAMRTMSSFLLFSISISLSSTTFGAWKLVRIRVVNGCYLAKAISKCKIKYMQI